MVRLVSLLALGLCMAAALAADWHVAPDGLPGGDGSVAAPWDIASTLAGAHAVTAGDTVFLGAGTYRRRPDERYPIALVGKAGKPILIRPETGAHVIIDGGFELKAPAAYVWIRDLEVLVSEPQPATPVEEVGNDPATFTRPWGGIRSDGAVGCKYINLVVHDCREGFRILESSREDEVYGCIIYDCGWTARDGGHGSGINTRNREGVKTIADCIFVRGYYCTWHVYGWYGEPLDHYRIEGNISYNGQIAHIGGREPNRDLQVVDNVFYQMEQLRVGFHSREGDGAVAGNLLVGTWLDVSIPGLKQADNRIVFPWGRQPDEPIARLRPNRYDPARAHLAVFGWNRVHEVPVDFAPWLKAGDRFRLYDPLKLFGEPVYEGVYDGKPANVPVPGEFAAYVVRRVE
jgi:hypothetical protein